MFCRKCGAENPDDSLFCQSCGTRFSKTSVGEPIPPSGQFDEEQVLRDALAGRYEVLRKLGAGGMANVYYARETALERYVAVKVLPQAYLRNEDFVERFKREAKISARLEHPNIITIHTIGIEENLIYFVMNYLPNGSIADRIKAKHALDIMELIRWGRDMCKALSYAHGHGVIHRDLKPENVMLDDNLNAVVTDFGIAFAAEGTRMTRAGTAVGTASYMSPEQAAGKNIDARSDIYSLGVMLYQMSTGALPFEATNPASLMYQHVHEAPKPPDAHNVDLPPWMCDIILKCLRKKPVDRFATAGEVLGALTGGFKAFQAEIDRQHGIPSGETDTALLSAILKTVPTDSPASSPPEAPPQKPAAKPSEPVNQEQPEKTAPPSPESEKTDALKKRPRLKKKPKPAVPEVPAPEEIPEPPSHSDTPTIIELSPDPGEATSPKVPVFPVQWRRIPVKKAAAIAAAAVVLVILMRLLGGGDAPPAFEWLMEPQFDWAQTFSDEGLARVMVGSHYGFVNRDGVLAVEARYDDVWPFEGAFTAVKENGRWGFISTSGEVLIEPQFENARGYSGGFVPIKLDGLWGFVNSRGTLSINPQFEDVGMFEEGIAPVFRNSRWGFINTAGALITPSRYENVAQASEGFAAVRYLGKWGYVNMAGKVHIEPQFEWAGLFLNGRALIKQGDGWGYIDSTGELVIPAVFHEAAAFEGGFARVMVDDRWGFIDPAGTYLTEPEFAEVDVFSEGFALVSKGLTWGYIDSTGTVTIAMQFQDARDFTGGLAAVKTPAGWGYIDTTGAFVIEPQFENAYPFTEGIAAVQHDGKWGYIRLTD